VVVPRRETSLEQGMQVSMATLRAATTHQTPSHRASQWRYLLALDLPDPPMRGGREREKTAAQMHVSELETNSTTSHSWNAQYVRLRNPVCPTRRIVHRLLLTIYI